MSQSFDPHSMPLDGQRLIEASAGTGKTFNLAALYLRLIVERQVPVREILVITFTRAAAKELRERIRQRLVAAARLAHEPGLAESGNPEDALAETLIAATDEDRATVARRLADAANRMDEATITTIHGFTQKAAAENAFDSALPFDRGEQVDDRPIVSEVAADYWRARAIGNEAEPGFVEWWPTPDDLVQALQPFRARPHARLAGPDDDEIAALATRVRDAWATDGAAFADALRACWQDDALKNDKLKLAIEAQGGIEEAMALLDERLAADQAIPALPGWTRYLTNPESEFKKKMLERGEALFEQPLAQALCCLQPLARLVALRQARTWIEATVIERKLERRQFSFDDMIAALYSAVTDDTHGPALAAALHAAWPWALVDEFQDTDPRQYAILRHIYAGRETGGLILIGDPKQSIYGFRGGDVYTYLAAANDTDDAPRSLDRNFRATQGLLDAVETLFRTPGDDPFLVAGIDYQTVTAGCDDHRSLYLNGERIPPMTVWRLTSDNGKKDLAEHDCLNACIERIRALLDPAERQLDPSDIAVLVNTNAQAATTQRALARIGVAAVCLHQASVFGTEEAADMLHVLKAAATPADERVLRAALTGPLLAHRLGDLLRLTEDEPGWRTAVDRFQSAHQRWQRNGVLAALQPLIQDGAERLLAYEDGERRMSNYLQIAELLAGAERETFGMAGLLHWLRRTIRAADNGETGEAEQLRLESDAALVRIATVHKAKGLEYPVVFLPFAPWLGAKGEPGKPPLDCHDVNNHAVTDIVGDPANCDAAVREARAEGLRLLYVALTRAELACFLPWGAANGTPNSALASLLHRTDGIEPTYWGAAASAKPLTNALVEQRLDALAEQADGAIHVAPLPTQTGAIKRLPADAPPAGEARSAPGQTWPPWAVHSFTRLVHAAEPGPAEAGAGDEDPPASEEPETGSRALPELPGGRAFGSAVHALLELAEPDDWPPPEQPLPERQRHAVAGMLRRYGIAVGTGNDGRATIDATAGLIRNTLHTPLPDIGPLAAVPAHKQLAEMAFMLRLRGPALTHVLAELNAAGYATGLRREAGGVLRGLMHGYIDLVVESGGRYFVLDYKTNWLGSDAADYAPAALEAAVQQHHYDLQYLIYVTALHRYLRQRLPDYDPTRHLGGVQYLFLRGMAPDAGGHGIYHHRPGPSLIQRLDALLDDGEVAA